MGNINWTSCSSIFFSFTTSSSGGVKENKEPDLGGVGSECGWVHCTMLNFQIINKDITLENYILIFSLVCSKIFPTFPPVVV